MTGNDKAGLAAWFVFRCMARFFGSMFFPLFRCWGETEHKKGRLFIAKNFGLLSLVCALRVFCRPVKIIIVGVKHRSIWLKAAIAGGLSIKLAEEADFKATYETICRLIKEGETVLLLIPQKPSEETLSLVADLKESVLTLFMAVSGAKRALPKNALVAKIADISIFCALPYVSEPKQKSPLYELELLEQAVERVPLTEVPSLFCVKN